VPTASDQAEPKTILAIASYDKGADFLRQCKRSGWRTLLLTSESLRGDNNFPADEIDEIFYMPDDNKVWNTEHTIKAVSYLARTEQISRIVPMDDFDLENAAALREHLRIPGMGSTTTHHFRDKLAMRMEAKAAGLNIPEFCGIIHHPTVHAFTQRVAGPWVLKPRFLAGALGIKKAQNADELWGHINALGDSSSFYLVEKYIPGDIFHVDALTEGGKQLFARASGYGRPPLDVTHGDIFTTRTLDATSKTAQMLVEANTQVLKAMRLVRGASHTEFIVGKEDGKAYFLETAARVGGASITDLVEAATGVNLWAEWAKLEMAGGDGTYTAPTPKDDHAALMVTLAKQEWPDSSGYNDPEIVWRMKKRFHVGMVVKSPRYERVTELLDSYRERIRGDFFASAPPKDKPTD
jgi:biotin carboxylase